MTPNLDGPLAFELAALPRASVAGDWNGDGKLDVATSNDDGSVTTLLGSGDGSFSTNAGQTSGLEAMLTASDLSSIATLDLNRDGKRDLVVAHSGLPRVSVLLNGSSGAFAPGIALALAESPLGLALADFDGDANADIATVSEGGTVELLAGNGDGTFRAGMRSSFGSKARSVAASDLNHDGHVDLVTVGPSEAVVLLGKGDGTFARTLSYPNQLSYHLVTLADFNHDGNADLALSVSCGEHQNAFTGVQISLGNGDGSFGDPTSYSTAEECPERIAIGDLNGDGVSDLVTSTFSSLLGNADGTFAPLAFDFKAGGDDLLGVADWNGDGTLDLLTNGERWIGTHLGNGDGSFGLNETARTPYRSEGVLLTDLDLDGALDITVATDGTWHGGPGPTPMAVLRGLGNGSFGAYDEYELPSHSSDTLAVDLNHDAWPDLVTTDGSSISVLLATGGGQFAAAQTSPTTTISALAAGDLNGDGHPDLLAANGSLNTVTLWRGNGDGTLSAQSPWALGASAIGIALFDANADGFLDAALNHYERSAVSLLLGRGDGTFSMQGRYPTGDRQWRLIATDLNADGKVDLVTSGSDALNILMSKGDGTFAPRIEYAVSTNWLIAADFDKNGTQDLVGTAAHGLTILFGKGDGSLTCSANYIARAGMLDVGDLNHDGRMDVVTTGYAGIDVFLQRAR